MKKPGTPESFVPDSRERTSSASGASGEPQLSGVEGVDTGVSSVALDRGLLALAGQVPSTADPNDDAQVMLRVKAGDDSAFDYLVQKYRRAMMSFMYRMTHNAAVAEDLAQEVFLRVYRSRASYEPSAKFT